MLCLELIPVLSCIDHHIRKYQEIDTLFVDKFLCSIYVDDVSNDVRSTPIKITTCTGWIQVEKFQRSYIAESMLMNRLLKSTAKLSV